jgi:hypothetical protein
MVWRVADRNDIVLTERRKTIMAGHRRPAEQEAAVIEARRKHRMRRKSRLPASLGQPAKRVADLLGPTSKSE